MSERTTDATAHGPRPDALSTYTTSGRFDGRWFTEEDFGATRLGIRVKARLHHEISPHQEIAVYDSDFFGRFLTLDNLMMFTERDEFVYHEMLAHVPLCSLEEPSDVLIIGGGDCGVAREVLKHSTVRRIVQCDIDERVTRVCERFFDWTAEVASDPRVILRFADGIEYVENHRREFDVIVIDSTDPIGPAVGLFDREFYRKVAAALRPGGVMVAQTETPHWAAGVVGAIYAEIRAVFSHVSGYMGFIPTYPSGSWLWAYASNDTRHGDFVDEGRVSEVSKTCRYYTAGIQRAAFALPAFATAALDSRNVFEQLDERNRRNASPR